MNIYGLLRSWIYTCTINNSTFKMVGGGGGGGIINARRSVSGLYHSGQWPES